MGHHVDRVRLQLRAVLVLLLGRDRRHHRVGDLVVGFRPGIDDLVVLLTLGDQAIHVLLFEFLDLFAGLVDQRPLVVGNDHVVLAEGDPGLERLAEAHGHDLVAEDDALLLTAVAVDGVDDLLHLFLPQKTVHQIERSLGVQRQEIAQKDAARRGFERGAEPRYLPRRSA
jgi:hypothetical protein